MRMWMCDPKIMCRQHLMGEYRELFTFVGSLRKKRKLDGHLFDNQLEPLSITIRYWELKKEMLRRGYHPVKEFVFEDKLLDYLGDKKFIKIDKEKSKKLLMEKCMICQLNNREVERCY